MHEKNINKNSKEETIASNEAKREIKHAEGFSGTANEYPRDPNTLAGRDEEYEKQADLFRLQSYGLLMI